MQFNTYTYAGAHIAAWLVNHPAPEAVALAQVLYDHDVHEPTATTGQVLILRPWAQRLRGVFESRTLSAKARCADELLVASDCRPRLVSHGPGLPFHLHYASVRAGLAPRVKALTAAGLAHAIDDGAGSACGPVTVPAAAPFSSTSRATGAATSAASGVLTRST